MRTNLKWLPNGQPDYEASTPTPPASRTLEQCRQELKYIDPNSDMGKFLRQRIWVLTSGKEGLSCE